MQQNQCLTMGRTQLAQMYFPYVLPQTAWQKLRSLLNEDPDLAHLAKLKRRTFLPVEVNIIYQHLGQPWAALNFLYVSMLLCLLFFCLYLD